MEKTHYERVKRLFLEAEPLSETDRVALLDERCAGNASLRDEVLRLLAAHESECDVLNTCDAATATTAPRPNRVGQYSIESSLGHGGMGVVYRATQANPKRTVALKLIRPEFTNGRLSNPALLRRFEVEAQILGRLQHPGIAQIFEAGTADTGSGPQPFFAMELIDGEPLTRSVEQRNLDPKQRLRLFCHVCDALQHAHLKGVIHRDLKPANILVTPDAQPKILDFGVARLTDDAAPVTTVGDHPSQLIGTLPYMSPEQLEGPSSDLDPRSDVYALGVILYELLAGRLPHPVEGKSLPQAIKILSQSDPVPITVVAPRIDPDIATIIHKAIEQERARRYQSAAELATDIRRYLANEPINARPATATYQLRKLVARHRLPAALLACLFITLIGFGAWMSYLYADANASRLRAERAETLKVEEARRANESAALAQRIQAFLVDLFELNNPDESRGQSITAREILDRGAERVTHELEAEPLVQAAMMEVIAQVCINLSLYNRAESLAQRALTIRKAELDPAAPQIASSLQQLAALASQAGEFEKAISLIEESIAISEESLSEGHPDTAKRLVLLGEIHLKSGSLEQSEDALTTALDMQRRALGEGHPDLGETLNQLVYLRRAQDRLQDAAEFAQQSVDNQTKAHGPNHTNTAAARVALGDTLFRLGKLDEAESVIRMGLKTLRDRLEPGHPYIAATLNNLGMVLKAKNEYAAARETLTESLDLRRKRFGARHPDIAQGLCNLASLDIQQGRAADAEPLLAEALEILESHFEPNHHDLLYVRYQHGFALLNLDRFADAEQALRLVLRGYEETFPPGHRFIAYTQGQLGAALTGLERFEEAESLLLESREAFRDSHGPWQASSARRLHELYTAWNRPTLAERYKPAPPE